MARVRSFQILIQRQYQHIGDQKSQGNIAQCLSPEKEADDIQHRKIEYHSGKGFAEHPIRFPIGNIMFPSGTFCFVFVDPDQQTFYEQDTPFQG